jgi:hypothetical protein
VSVKYVVLSKSTLPTGQPIKETRLRLAGLNVYAKMSDVSPPQPTELIYCTALRVFPRQKREYPRRRYVSRSLTFLKFY